MAFKGQTIVCALSVALILPCCRQNNCKEQGKVIVGIDEVAQAKEDEAPIVKDRIDTLIEQRAEQVFNSTIFAGLRFGSSKKTVDKKLYNKRITRGVFITEIPLQVPNRDNVEEVTIRDFDATYYNDQLASLVLYANEARLINAIDVLYTNKYGETKNHVWRFSNCEISVAVRERERRYSDYTANYLTEIPMYYDSYRGGQTYYLTKEPCFLAITYKNHQLLHSIERQKIVADSLEAIKRIQEKQREKELAKKLREDTPTNI